ncbi:MAG: hypothetical protein Q7U78_03695 [Gallionella sp.]|nr:hypothetical protein [Gallionella sp.]
MPKKIIFTLLLVSVLVYLTRVGMADFLRLEPCAYVDAIKKGTARLDPAELDKTRERLKLARSWDAGNPVIPEYQAQTDFMLAQLVGFSPELQAKFLREAINNLQSAIALRPYSAYLWAARMTAGSWLLDIDEQQGKSVDHAELITLSASLRHAAVLDPWNPAILQQIVKVGKLRYSEFSDEVKTAVDESVIRAKHLSLKV